MSDTGCDRCNWRKKYDESPRSILGRLWRWHTGWCPGWRDYLRSLPADERSAILERYGMDPDLGRPA